MLDAEYILIECGFVQSKISYFERNKYNLRLTINF